MPRSRQYVMYSKLCIVCQNVFETTKVNTMCCTKPCRNRLRYLPQHVINSLIQRVSMFTTFKKYGDAIVSAPSVRSGGLFTPEQIAQGLAEAKALAARRGHTPPQIDQVLEDNLKYINKEDPAAGDADGFGVKPTIVHEDIKIEAQPYDNNSTVESDSSVVGGTGSSNGNDSQENSTGGLASVKRNGLRRLGGR